MKKSSICVVVILSMTFSMSIFAGTMCNIRENPSIQSQYEYELGGLKSLGWDPIEGKAKAKFISLFDKNGLIISGEQEVSGDALKAQEQKNGDITFTFSMPSGQKYLLRAFNYSGPKVMIAYAALINETQNGPQLSLSYGREFLDCIIFDL